MNEALLIGIAGCLAVVTMTARSGESAKRYRPPRLADGTPDLQATAAAK